MMKAAGGGIAMGIQQRLKSNPSVGSTIWIRYKGGVKGEEPIDDYWQGEPKKFVLGMSNLPYGIEESIMTLSTGDFGTFEIPPAKGYGEYREMYAVWYPRSLVEHGYDLKKNSILFWPSEEDGSQVPAYVKNERPDVVLIDFNHPLAGKTLEYQIELVHWV